MCNWLFVKLQNVRLKFDVIDVDAKCFPMMDSSDNLMKIIKINRHNVADAKTMDQQHKFVDRFKNVVTPHVWMEIRTNASDGDKSVRQMSECDAKNGAHTHRSCDIYGELHKYRIDGNIKFGTNHPNRPKGTNEQKKCRSTRSTVIVATEAHVWVTNLEERKPKKNWNYLWLSYVMFLLQLAPHINDQKKIWSNRSVINSIWMFYMVKLSAAVIFTRWNNRIHLIRLIYCHRWMLCMLCSGSICQNKNKLNTQTKSKC